MPITSERDIIRLESRWAVVALSVAGGIFLLILWAAAIAHHNPPSNAELIDPKGLHLTNEFTEANLGTRVERDGHITARIIATQFEFVPSCVVLPAERPVTMRLASPDVIHGVLVSDTNVNTMVVPGFVSQVHTVFHTTGDHLMPCHEYCGLGHSQMLGRIRIVSPQDFHPGPDGRIYCAQR